MHDRINALQQGDDSVGILKCHAHHFLACTWRADVGLVTDAQHVAVSLQARAQDLPQITRSTG